MSINAGEIGRLAATTPLAVKRPSLNAIRYFDGDRRSAGP
jgi:hypothetical protein